MAAEDNEFFLTAHVEELDHDAAAARAKRIDEGTWDRERILKNYEKKQQEIERELRKRYEEKQQEIERKLPEEMKSSMISLDSGPPNWEEESSALGKRHFGFSFGCPELASSANLLSVRVLKSPVGYPVHVYGEVFARDIVDNKRIYFFRRQRDNSQKINCKDEVLSLTGPSRGLILSPKHHFAINLKSKNDQVANDRVIGKSFLKFQAATCTSQTVTNILQGKQCAVELIYALINRAIEATVEVRVVEILRIRESPPLKPNRRKEKTETTMEWLPFNKKRIEHREFHGKISVSIAGYPEDVVLYDSKAEGSVMVVGDGGLVTLSRRIVAIPVDRLLWIKIVSPDGDIVSELYPRPSGCSAFNVSAGSYRLRYSFTWSALFSPKVDDSGMLLPSLDMVKL